MQSSNELSFAAVRQLCSRFGLSPCGVISSASDPVAKKRYKAWIEAGMHGSMSFLERHTALKTDPTALLSGCRSVLFVALGYYQTPGSSWVAGKERSQAASNNDVVSSDSVSGRIAQYAWGRDYHKLLRARLRALSKELSGSFPQEKFVSGVDSTPLLEANFAVKAGIGFRGKHTLVINKEHGSWFFIGELLTTLAISEGPQPSSKRCSTDCTYCIDVCPTKAIVEPYKLDARRCISYLTIEHRGPIPKELRPAIGNWLFGCDLCQEVCPWTVRAQATVEPDLLNWRAGSSQDLEPLLDLRSHKDLTARFAGSPLMRAGRDRLVRNACTVAGNRRAIGLLPRLQHLMGDSDLGVSDHARWAVEQIRVSNC